MLTKILLTFGVIVVCIWMIVSRRNAPQQKNKTTLDKAVLSRQKWLRRGAWLFMAFMITMAFMMVMVEHQEKNALITVHVINTQSGERISYQTRQSDVKQNSFITTEGRQIFIAGIERIEIEKH